MTIEDQQALSQEVWEMHLQESMEAVHDLRTVQVELELERGLVIVLNKHVEYLKAQLSLMNNELAYYMEASSFGGP